MTRRASGPTRRPTGPAPWVRTRLRATPYAALLTAALVLATAFLAAALPRALDRSADGALRELVARSGPTADALLATTTTPQRADSTAADARAADLDRVAGTFASHVRDPLRIAPAGEVYGSRSRSVRVLPGPSLPRPGNLPPVALLGYLNDLPSHAVLTAGRWPDTVHGARYEAALSEPVARLLGVHPGDRLDAGDATARPEDGRAELEVVGVFRPTDPAGSAFWSGVDCATAPCQEFREVDDTPLPYWQVRAMVGRGELDALPTWAQGSEDFFQIPLDRDAFRTDRLPAVRGAIGSLLSGPQFVALQQATARVDFRVTSPLPTLFADAEHRRAAIAPLTVLGPVGAAGVACTVLLLAAALATDRRAAELRLLRARGASPGGLLRRLLGESAATVLPAAVAGTALALLTLPTPRWGGAVLGGAAVGLVALLAFPVHALRTSAPAAGPAAADPGRADRRRLVLEGTALVAAAAAVVAVRRRGVAPPGGGVDLLLVAGPLLLALVGALLLARCHPPLIGWAARRAARRSGLVGFLGLARAARGGGARRRPTVLPLLALLLAVTTAGFGATVLSSVDTGRERAARQEVGADARVTGVDGAALPDGFADAAAHLPGARGGVPGWVDYLASVATGDGDLLPNVTVLVIDPGPYAELARRAGRGTFDPAVLAAGGPTDPVPALVSHGVAERLDTAPHDAHLSDGHVIGMRKAGEIDSLLTGGGEVVLLPAAQVRTRLHVADHPNLWFGTGDLRADPLRALLRRSGPDDGYEVRTAADVVDRLAGDPLQKAAARMFDASIGAAAGFAVLAVLLTLVRSGPERAAVLARLRTMGLRPRQGLALILAEALPHTLLAAAVGALVATVAALLLGPAVDLAAVIGATATGGSGGVRPAALPLLGQAALLAAVAAATVLAEAAISGRRQITTELRAGDER